jgi:hypothetical protein
VLLGFCTFVVIYQATQGSCLWIYLSEIVVNEVAMGLALFTLMITMTIQSCFAPLIISKCGLDVIFYALGIFQAVPVIVFTFFLKETQGLSTQQKKKLYTTQSAEAELNPKDQVKKELEGKITKKHQRDASQ